jgi:hypothetical protein
MNNIQTLWSNPHLRYCVIAMAAIEIAAIWLPSFKVQLDETKSVIILYALAVAANSTPNQPPTKPT